MLRAVVLSKQTPPCRYFAGSLPQISVGGLGNMTTHHDTLCKLSILLWFWRRCVVSRHVTLQTDKRS